MNLRHKKTILQSNTTKSDYWRNRVVAICYSPDNERLAIIASDRCVKLFNDNGEQVDKFNTKPNGKGPKSYKICGAQFCPEIGFYKLAIAQSDCIVFVYKWSSKREGGKELTVWNGHKSISNKFPEKSPVTCINWPSKRPNEIVYGLSDGAVKIGYLRSNKSQTLYRAESFVVSITSDKKGASILSAHIDGSIMKYIFSNDNQSQSCSKLIQHSCPVYALAWGYSICIAGNDQKVVFYDQSGCMQKCFKYDGVNCKDFTVAACNPTGDTIIVGNFNSFYLFSWDLNTQKWEEKNINIVKNMCSATSIAWKTNASSFAIGSSIGTADVYDSYIRRYLYKNMYEITYVSPSRVIIRNNDDMETLPVTIQSKSNLAVNKICAYRDQNTKIYRYIVARTQNSLLLKDMDCPQISVSEIEWTGDGSGEKFSFDSSSCCIIRKAGELSIIEFGSNKVLASFRTEFVSTHLLSIRVNEGKETSSRRIKTRSALHESKQAAFLLDQQTICIKNLISSVITTINHDVNIDFLELNYGGDSIIFRDMSYCLHFFDLKIQKKTCLLNQCTYVQWVPGSNVLVAQDQNRMCVWYNIKAPDQVVIREIDGCIDGIERTNGKTEVFVDEKTSIVTYELVEDLIEFGTALEQKEYFRATNILEEMEMSPQSEAMWEQLLNECIENWKLCFAQRCAAALGNVSLARYIQKMNKPGLKCNEEVEGDCSQNWQIRANMFELNGKFKNAEDIYLTHGKAEYAVSMYKKFDLYLDAIELAERINNPNVEQIKKDYISWLLNTDQTDQAAKVYVSMNKFETAIDLYMNAGLPGKAASIILKYGIIQPESFVLNICRALEDTSFHEEAGELYAKIGERQKALDNYVKSNAYAKAIDLSRDYFPKQVVVYEEAFGDYLVSINQIDDALIHYREAHALRKATQVAVSSRRWNDAELLIDQLDSEKNHVYHKELAEYLISSKQYDKAEKYLSKSKKYEKAVLMYVEANMLEQGLILAKSKLSDQQLDCIFAEKALEMERRGLLEEAENLYLAIHKFDDAISMHKTNRNFSKMLELVTTYRNDSLNEAYKYIGKLFEGEGNLKKAEEHYIEAGDWLIAVNMYRENDMWEDALRVAKYLGDYQYSKKLSYMYAAHVGEIMGVKVLVKLNLLETAIDFAAENGALEHAFQLAHASCPTKIVDLHYRYALKLENEQLYIEAEEEFIKARKPKEAVDMYIHQSSWLDAMRVATKYLPSCIKTIYLAQAQAFLNENNLELAEKFFIKATKPELALKMYQDFNQAADARRIVNQYLPHMIHEINTPSYDSNLMMKNEKCNTMKSDFTTRGEYLEKENRYNEAIDVYLEPTEEILSNREELEEVWMHAVRVARCLPQDKKNDVFLNVSANLIKIKNYDKAISILCDSNQFEEAVKVAIGGKCWERAKEIATKNSLLHMIADTTKEDDQCLSNSTGKFESPNCYDRLDYYAGKKEWDNLWDEAAKSNVTMSICNKYSILQINQALLDDDDDCIYSAIKNLYQNSAPDFEENHEVYQNLVIHVLRLTDEREKRSNFFDMIQLFRQVFNTLRSKLLEAIRKSSVCISLDLQQKFDRLFMSVHFTAMLQLFLKFDLFEQALKCAVTLLQYAGTLIPSDKAFYIAGNLCKKQKYLDFAIMLFNHYIDLIEVLDDEDNGNSSSNCIQNNDFSDTNLIPKETIVPKRHYVTEEYNREEIRDWVLSKCMDMTTEHLLPSEMDSTGTIYEVLYNEPISQLPPLLSLESQKSAYCYITGYPLKSGQETLHLKSEHNDNITVDQYDWKTLVQLTHVCPWSGKEQRTLSD